MPALVARGFVFAAPVLRFGAPGPADTAACDLTAHPAADTAEGDLNGDGRADTCRRDGTRVLCALASPTGLLAESVWADGVEGSIALVDTNHDGRADLCVASPSGATRALSP